MKVYALSDYHNDEELLPEMRKRARRADLVVIAGDLSVFEFDLDKNLREFDEWGKPVLVIHGNHEDDVSLAEAVKKYEHIEFIHGQEIVKDKVRILAWGGGGFTTTDRGLIRQAKEWAESEHKDKPTLLATHPPPHGTALDVIHSGEHVGNKSVRHAIKKLQPRYAVSGHIHECEGAEDTIGPTTCYNLGPLGKILEF
ncbi:metallophosphoesterase [Candidatus Woesearchaeota archaeon]|nr:metallophosphoesterase [Candidatus Woesearchaeota archaeon]